MKRYIRSSSSEDAFKDQIASMLDRKVIPENGSVIHTSGRDGEYYWKVDWVVPFDEIDNETVEDYESAQRFAANAIFLLELPRDPFGGMALGDIAARWEYSTYDEAEANNFGNHDSF